MSVFSFLLEDSHKNKHSQLERLIFSENFLKEENGGDLRTDPTGIGVAGGSEAQLRHRKHVQVDFIWRRTSLSPNPEFDLFSLMLRI